ncbi:MAG TPA: hypothetical protein DD638_12060, partial [Pasteurellaceae bacterium]|nr:hypothetical protein [Pasteurellaceae bacterium]
QFSRDINSNDIFTSPLSYGVTPFTVNVDNHRLELTLDTPKQVKSGETIEFKLSGNKPSKAVIYAVNEGILQVAGYQLNDPLKFFFPKHALQVETLQILDLILPEFSQIMQFAKIGGDDGSQELSALAQRAKIAAENSNPFKRKVDKPVVYWSGIVDVNGEKTVRYQIPEGFNGNLKVMAIAVGDDNDTMGIVENETLVRDDIILSPTVPLVLTPGDRSQLSVSVANNTATTKNITVKVAADPQITLIGAAEKTIDVPPMTEHAVEFEVNATEVGASKLHFTASYSNDRQQSEEVMRSISLSVRPTQPKQYFTQIGKVESGKALNTSLPALLYPQQRSQAALFSPAPMVLAQGISAYLADYDNYCTEQIISSAMPALLFAKNPEYQPIFAMFSNLRQHENDLTQASEQAIQKSLNKAFDLLPSRQMENGEYGIWDNINDSNPFVTAYVAHFLIEALEHNVQRIPTAWFNEDGLFNKTMRALDQQSMPREGDSLVILRQRAYSAYLLTRLAQVPSNALISIRTQLEQNFKAQDWQTDLTAAWLAAAYKNLQQDSEAAKLIDPVVTQLLTERNTQWQYGYYYDPLIEDSSALYVIARHFPEKLEAVSDVVLARINKALNEQRYNTLSSAMVLLALDSYTQQHQANAEQLNINVNGKDISQLQGAFRLAVLDAEKADLNFINQSSQAAWFAISQSGYPQKASGQNLQNGLEIDRTYTDKNGKEISNVKIGDIINVTVKLRADRHLVPDVVITDLFPAGFEVIWQKGGEESSKDFWNPVHTDLREDRMLSYGDAKSETRYLTYQLKAVNIGTFNIPAVYAESMYDRSIKALVIGKGSIKIEK